MNESQPEKKAKKPLWHSFHQEVKIKATRKIKARQERKNPLIGLGMFGMVGWSVVIPTLLGLALGLWLDRKLPSNYSWTLMLLFVGLILGCCNAWYWIQKESNR